MDTIFGLTIAAVSLFGWIGQIITSLSPPLAEKLTLTEPESDVAPAFYADVRGEAYWDSFILWILPVAGILLLMGNPNWAYFGLIGGGIFFYFAGRGIVTRLVLTKRGIAIGKPETLKINISFLIICILVSIFAIVLAVRELAI